MSPRVTAHDKIERSKLSKAAVQRELMGDDLDLEQLLVYMRSKVAFDAIDRITAADVSRTIEGASTFTVTINDQKRDVLRSGLLGAKLDVKVDGLWFRLVKVRKTGDDLELTFEDREIAVLRTYDKPKWAKRAQVTRAEFVLNLIREPKEYKGDPIPVIIPELHKVQPIEKSADLPSWGTGSTADSQVSTSKGIVSNNLPQESFRHGEPGNAANVALTVKGAAATSEQIRNANTILQVGESMGANRKVLVVSIMVAIQESRIINLSGGDADSVGIFQQRKSWGSFRDRHDPATAARLFFNHAIDEDRLEPDVPHWTLAADVQRPRSDLRLEYSKWRTEAERFVMAYGVPPGTAAESNAQKLPVSGADGSNYLYYRADPVDGLSKVKPEDSWSCIQRLADEVDWRAFFVSGVFYWIADDELMKMQPVARIGENTRGVENIDFDYDTNKRSATVTVTARVGTWLIPPGAVVVLLDMGPGGGRWLVTDYSRSIFDSTATITLKKARPRLPEPAQNSFSQALDWSQDAPVPGDPNQDPALFGGLPNTDGSRNAVASVAEYAAKLQKTEPWRYLQSRPFPASLFSVAAHSGIDCSAFAILVYKEAGVEIDPSGNNYNGGGNTGDLAARGTWVFQPAIGDMVFYGGTKAFPGHVAIFIGAGRVVEIGSNLGIIEQPVNYRSDLIGYKSYFASAIG